jgi:hypothetical protein
LIPATQTGKPLAGCLPIFTARTGEAIINSLDNGLVGDYAGRVGSESEELGEIIAILGILARP